MSYRGPTNVLVEKFALPLYKELKKVAIGVREGQRMLTESAALGDREGMRLLTEQLEMVHEGRIIRE